MPTPLALYIHWPFCVSKCPYCDFNSHVRETVDQAQWRAALLADMAYEAALTSQGLASGRQLSSIFFGGGTPSLMPPETVAALISAAEQHWGFADDIEITLEANPSSVEAARFADLAKAGINRVSLGIQSLENKALQFLGRAHDVKEALAALDIAQGVFKRVSFDLIYARPEQSASQWEAELRQALSFGTDHMSLYQLTIEPGTRFATMVAKQDFTPLDPDHGAELFELTQSLTNDSSMTAYEISNHARAGQESRHNLTYWRYGDYIGIGPGAHGRRTDMATLRHKKPENWMTAIDRNQSGLQSETRLDNGTKAMEALLMGLRLREGVDLDKIAKWSGFSIEELVSDNAIKNMKKLNLLDKNANHISITEKGMLLLDAILPEIVLVEPIPS